MTQTEGAVLVQYVFLDVVRFTQGRTVEAQVEVVGALNSAVSTSLALLEIGPDSRILLPTGDGLALALIQPGSFDLALRLAQTILQQIQFHNAATADERRRFEVRVGVNQNIDNLVIDINGNQNVAGRGINQAQRIMSNADGSQILIGESTYDILCEREAYADHFRPLPGRGKHGNRFKVYQLIHPEAEWLNISLPARFKPALDAPNVLTEYAAHFIANAAAHHEFLLQRRRETCFPYDAAVLVHMLTLDSIAMSKKSPLEEPVRKATLAGDGTPLPAWLEISASLFWMRTEISSLVAERLWDARECFEARGYHWFWSFPSAKGIDRVQREYPGIWAAVVGEKVALELSDKARIDPEEKGAG
jgi:class 3 adenylate cyclase